MKQLTFKKIRIKVLPSPLETSGTSRITTNKVLASTATGSRQIRGLEHAVDVEMRGFTADSYLPRRFLRIGGILDSEELKEGPNNDRQAYSNHGKSTEDANHVSNHIRWAENEQPLNHVDSMERMREYIEPATQKAPVPARSAFKSTPTTTGAPSQDSKMSDDEDIEMIDPPPVLPKPLDFPSVKKSYRKTPILLDPKKPPERARSLAPKVIDNLLPLPTKPFRKRSIRRKKSVTPPKTLSNRKVSRNRDHQRIERSEKNTRVQKTIEKDDGMITQDELYDTDLAEQPPSVRKKKTPIMITSSPPPPPPLEIRVIITMAAGNEVFSTQAEVLQIEDVDKAHFTQDTGLMATSWASTKGIQLDNVSDVTITGTLKAESPKAHIKLESITLTFIEIGLPWQGL